MDDVSRKVSEARSLPIRRLDRRDAGSAGRVSPSVRHTSCISRGKTLHEPFQIAPIDTEASDEPNPKEKLRDPSTIGQPIWRHEDWP